VAYVLLAGCAGAAPEGLGAEQAGDLCEQAFVEASRLTGVDGAKGDLDAAIRRCRTLGDWQRHALAYPVTMGGRDSEQVLLDRCADPIAGLAGYQVCGLLRIALATPSPTPKPTRKPKPTPGPTPRRTPRPTPKPTARPDIAGYRSAVCGAFRTLRADIRMLDEWRNLPSIKRELDYELALANLNTPGSTPGERYSRWAAAVAKIEEAWANLAGRFRRDAGDIAVDIALVNRALARSYRYPTGARSRKQLTATAKRVNAHARAIRSWLRKHESSGRLARIFADLDTTSRTLTRLVKELPVDCT
jgi:hypothetical protein